MSTESLGVQIEGNVYLQGDVVTMNRETYEKIQKKLARKDLRDRDYYEEALDIYLKVVKGEIELSRNALSSIRKALWFIAGVLAVFLFFWVKNQ